MLRRREEAAVPLKGNFRPTSLPKSAACQLNLALAVGVVQTRCVEIRGFSQHLSKFSLFLKRLFELQRVLSQSY